MDIDNWTFEFDAEDVRRFQTAVSNIASAQTDDFLELAGLAGMDVTSDLAGVDLSELDLSEADLSKTLMEGSELKPEDIPSDSCY